VTTGAAVAQNAAMPATRILTSGDEALLESFLLPHATTSMFLRSNSREVGLVDRGLLLHATYAAAFDGAQISAVASHSWNGNILLQGDAGLEEAAALARATTGREVRGILGPWEQVVRVRRSLGFDETPTSLASRETLFHLPLDRLRVPPSLEAPGILCRHVEARDLPSMIDWRISYTIETLGAVAGDALRAQSTREITTAVERRSCWLLEVDGVAVAYSGINATLPDIVQIGGVWTPVPLRGRGYARAAVAGSLLELQGSGVREAILFTQPGNAAAQAAYRALGFEPIGHYGLVLFA
jgi:RimJ/RimL family protein N-acetyltransferase